MPTIEHSTRSRGYLPHWENAHATYFVTFRLADSLPQELLARLRWEREVLERARDIPNPPAGRRRYSEEKRHSEERRCPDERRSRELTALLKEAESCLDDGLGRCHLSDPRVARLVADATRHFHGRRYELVAWCVMPNHVHVLFSPLGEYTLESILHGWKSFSAHAANRLLRRTGPFWQREYFDHLVRHESSRCKIIAYIRDNPKKSGLRDWPWIEVLGS